MTEPEWLTCTDPERMLEHLRNSGRASHRKLRLWICACVRRIWHLLDDVRSRNAVEVAERFADASASSTELKITQGEAIEAAKAIAQGAAVEAAKATSQPPDARAYYDICMKLRAANSATGTSVEDVWQAATTAPLTVARSTGLEAILRNQEKEPRDSGELRVLLGTQRSPQATLLREVFGNPFRPVTIDQAWLTPSTAALVQSIYDDRAFHRMPELADALKEAGCTNVEVLSHCRGPGSHVRGCWAVDLLLVKE